MELEGFFHERLSRYLGPPVQGYVVSVLVDYAHARLSDEALCLLLGDMKQTRVLSLKTVGDESLFLSGFMYRDSRYYGQLGRTAYWELADRLRDPLFRSMAVDFTDIQDSLRSLRSDIRREGFQVVLL